MAMSSSIILLQVEADLTIPLLVQAWNRGAALMCKPCVEAIDHVIPIMLAPESNKSPHIRSIVWRME